MTHEKYTELLCRCIYGTDWEEPEPSLPHFKTGQPQKCPACGGNLWNNFNPACVIHDLVAYENAVKMPHHNQPVATGSGFGWPRPSVPGWRHEPNS